MNIFTLQRLRELGNEQDTHQERQTTTPKMPTTKLVNTEIHTVNGVQISGGNNQVTVIYKDGKMQSVETEPVEPAPEPESEHELEPSSPQKTNSAIPASPRPNDYCGLIWWLESQDIDWRKTYSTNRSQAAEMLSKIVNWTIDPRTWGRAENRKL